MPGSIDSGTDSIDFVVSTEQVRGQPSTTILPSTDATMWQITRGRVAACFDCLGVIDPKARPVGRVGRAL
jgi:hypothetical protein